MDYIRTIEFRNMARPLCVRIFTLSSFLKQSYISRSLNFDVPLLRLGRFAILTYSIKKSILQETQQAILVRMLIAVRLFPLFCKLGLFVRVPRIVDFFLWVIDFFLSRKFKTVSEEKVFNMLIQSLEKMATRRSETQTS